MTENKKYAVIYADPPWKYRHRSTGPNGRGAAEHHYQTLTMQQIMDFPLPSITDDAFLWMWATNPVMAEGHHAEIFEAWGFQPQGILTWVKDGIGMGYTLRSATEHIIVGRRGHPKVNNHSISTWFKAARLPHSQKPEEARRIIEKMCDGPYVELFARRRIDGWDCLGDQLGQSEEQSTMQELI